MAEVGPLQQRKGFATAEGGSTRQRGLWIWMRGEDFFCSGQARLGGGEEHCVQVHDMRTA